MRPHTADRSAPGLLLSLLLLCGLFLAAPELAAQDDIEIEVVEAVEETLDSADTEELEDPWELPDNFSMSPPFGQGSSGAHLSFGFALSGIAPESLDPDLGGDLVLNVFELYFMNKGLLFGGSWTTSALYDAPNYDQFLFDYKGLLLGYDYSLFYGKMSVRPAIMLGRGEITMIRTRPDITADAAFNPEGREVLERLRDQDFYAIRPSFSIGWSPSSLVHFRLEGGFLYPTGGEGSLDDLREPLYTFHVMFGSNR